MSRAATDNRNGQRDKRRDPYADFDGRHAGRVPHPHRLPALEGLCERRSAVMYARLLMSPPMLDGHAVDNSQGFDGFTAHARAVSPLAAPHEPALNGGRGGFRGQNGHIE